VQPRAVESGVAFEVSIARVAPRAPINSRRDDVVELSGQDIILHSTGEYDNGHRLSLYVIIAVPRRGHNVTPVSEYGFQQYLW